MRTRAIKGTIAAALVAALGVVTAYLLRPHVSGQSAPVDATSDALTTGDPNRPADSNTAASSARPSIRFRLSPSPASRWKAEYRSASDLSEFLLRAATAAENGDAEAAWYVQEVVARCAFAIKEVREGLKDSQFVEFLLDRPPVAFEVELDLEETFRRCERIGLRPEFQTWTQEEGGKMSAAYWRERALDLGSAQAKSDAIVRSIGSSASAQDIDQMHRYAGDIVTTAHPDALFTLGFRILSADVSQDPKYGLALALAACDLGFDCTAEHREAIWALCWGPGPCAEVRSFPQWAQDQFGTRQYAEAYALAEQYNDALARGEREELVRIAHLDLVSFSGRPPDSP